MDAITILTLVFSVSVGLKYAGRFMELYSLTQRLKEQGKTPLTGKNTTTIASALAVEIVLVILVPQLIAPFFVATALTVVLFTVGMLFLLQITEYLTAWGVWSLFLRLKRQKMEKEIKENQKEEGTV